MNKPIAILQRTEREREGERAKREVERRDLMVCRSAMRASIGATGANIAAIEASTSATWANTSVRHSCHRDFEGSTKEMSDLKHRRERGGVSEVSRPKKIERGSFTVGRRCWT